MTDLTKPPEPLPETLPKGTRFLYFCGTYVADEPLQLKDDFYVGLVKSGKHSDSRARADKCDWAHYRTLTSEPRPIAVGDWVECVDDDDLGKLTNGRRYQVESTRGPDLFLVGVAWHHPWFNGRFKLVDGPHPEVKRTSCGATGMGGLCGGCDDCLDMQRANGVMGVVLARRFGVHKCIIYRIKSGEAWVRAQR